MGNPLSKKGLRTLGTILAVCLLTVHLYPSVAEFTPAASVPAELHPVHQATSPRLVALRRRTPSRLHATVLSPRGPTRPTAVQPKTRLETILDASGVRGEQRTLAGSALGLLDPACLEKLETFSVLYDNPKHRGLAGKGTILVSGIVPDHELVGLLLHEGLGHFRDITCVTGTPESGESAFRDGDAPVWNDDPSVSFYGISWMATKERKADAKREDFVTGYAYAGDSFEDLAESVTFYVTQEQVFRLRAASNPVLAQKLAWLETFMPKTKAITESDSSWDGNIAWDATKLPFQSTVLQVADVK